MASGQPSLWDTAAANDPALPAAAGERTHEGQWSLRSPDGIWHIRFGAQDDGGWWARTSSARSSQWLLEAASWEEAVSELCDMMDCSAPTGVAWADRRDRYCPSERSGSPKPARTGPEGEEIAGSGETGTEASERTATAADVSVEAGSTWRLAVVMGGHIRWLPKLRIADTAEEALSQTARSKELGIGKIRARQTVDGRTVAEAFDFGRQATLRAIQLDERHTPERCAESAEVGSGDAAAKHRGGPPKDGIARTTARGRGPTMEMPAGPRVTYTSPPTAFAAMVGVQLEAPREEAEARWDENNALVYADGTCFSDPECGGRASVRVVGVEGRTLGYCKECAGCELTTERIDVVDRESGETVLVMSPAAVPVDDARGHIAGWTVHAGGRVIASARPVEGSSQDAWLELFDSVDDETVELICEHTPAAPRVRRQRAQSVDVGL